MNTIFQKENWRKTSNHTGIRVASKEMVFATWFILNIAQEAREQMFLKNEHWTETLV